MEWKCQVNREKNISYKNLHCTCAYLEVACIVKPLVDPPNTVET